MPPERATPNTEHLRPRYHVHPLRGYLNDPNGPVQLDGRTHLYFQYRAEVDLAAPVSWGHVTSTDLVHWQSHEPAIRPHPGLPDRDGCWSGNTVRAPDGTLRAFYSGYSEGARPQTTLCAVSRDGGYSYDPPVPVVPDPPPGEEIQEMRDPFVWRQGSSWRMVLGAGTSDGTAMVRLYGSDDLQTWEYLGPLASLARSRSDGADTGELWECPQLLTVAARSVAVVGAWTAAEGIGQVLSLAVHDPELPAGPHPLVPRLVDHGPNFYAASVMRGSPHGPLMWGWATEGRSFEWAQDDAWSGVLTLPRVISLAPGGRLASAPVPELVHLRQDGTARESVSALGGLGAQLEFHWTCEPGEGAAHGLRLRFGQEEYLEILLDHAVGRLRVDRDHASRDPRAHRGGFDIVDATHLSACHQGIHGFVDGSILELFAPGGRVATARFYPSAAPPWRIELVGAATARVRVWELAAAVR